MVFFYFVFAINLLSYMPVKAGNLKTITVPLLEDTYVEEANPYTVHGGEKYLYIGYETNIGKQRTRVFVKPDYSFLNSKGVQPSQIRKVYLYLTYVDGSGSGATQVNLYRSDFIWHGVNLSWANQPGGTYVSYANWDFAPTDHKIVFTASFKRDYDYFLTMGEARGFFLKFKFETPGGGFMRFWGRECAQGAFPPHCTAAEKPHILVEYEDNTIPSAPVLRSPADNLVHTDHVLHFEAYSSTDPDNDPLEYRLQIAYDGQFSSIFKQSSWSPTPDFTMSISRDGEYYWRVQVRDPYGNKASSVARRFYIDTTPPPIPAFIPEPPYTVGDSNTLEWVIYPIENDVRYELQWSRSRDFSANNSTGWITDKRFTVQNLTEGPYYYRVRSKDKYGNMSDWSPVVVSIQDSTPPKLEKFAVKPLIIGPGSSGKVLIDAKFSDVSLKKSTLEIYDSAQRLIFSKDFISDRIWLYLNVTNWKDSTYFVYVVGTDSLGKRNVASPKAFRIDKTPPDVIVTPFKQNLIINKMPAVSVGCSETGKLFIYVRNKLYKTYNTFFSKPLSIKWLPLKQGSNKVRFVCKDIVGNAGHTESTIYYDSVAPEAPKIEVLINKTKKVAFIKCEYKAKVNVKLDGSPLYEGVCPRGNIQVDLPANITYGISHLITAKVVDAAGNVSKPSIREFRLPLPPLPAKASSSKEVFCEVNIFENQWAKTSTHKIRCAKNIEYELVRKEELAYPGKLAKNIYFRLPSLVKIRVRHFRCNAISFPIWYLVRRCWYAPLTTRGIVLRPQYTLSDGKVVYPLVYLRDKNLYNAQVKGASGQEKRLLLKGVFNPEGISGLSDIKDIPFLYSDLKIRFSERTVPSKPLDWIFFDYKNVRLTQRFGRTHYSRFHGGVDLGVYKKRIKTPARGTIVAARYHRRDKCLAGGYYVAVKHDNGLYTYYFHLSSLRLGNLIRRSGQRVNWGDALAITGNSGVYRCRKLKYHLHYEVRTCRYLRCRKDPLKYTNIDWSLLKVRY